MKAIEINAVAKSFETQQVLKDLTMSVNTGEIYGFLGPNGSGKTTTLRILVGLLSPDSGKISVLGMDPAKDALKIRRRVNVLPESHGFYGWMRAADYLSFYSQLYGVDLPQNDCQSYLEMVGLNPTDTRPLRTFSRGMKQRLGIARTLINTPEILFLDEPTSGLDPQGRHEIYDLFGRLNREKAMTIILSTHILEDVERLCTCIGILFGGRLEYEGPPTENMEKTYLKHTQER